MSADRIIGIGSSHEDDAIGWLVVDRLQGALPNFVDILAIQTHRLLDHLAGCRRLLLIDGCDRGQTPGTLLRLVWPDVRIRSFHGCSTHGLGLVESLELAEQLGRLPAQVILYGVQVGGCGPGANVGAAALGAVEPLLRRIQNELRARCEISVDGGSSPCGARATTNRLRASCDVSVDRGVELRQRE